MKYNSLKIALSCFIGGVLGTLIGLNFHSSLLLSIISGGLIGYLLYDFNKVIKAIPLAFKSVYSKMKKWKLNVDPYNVKTFLLSLIGGAFIFLYIFSFSTYLTIEDQGYKTVFPFKKLDFLLFSIFLIFFAIGVAFVIYGGNDNKVKKHSQRARLRALWFIRYFNPITAPFTVLFYVLKIAVIIINAVFCEAVPWLIVFAAKFIKQLFFLIHSELRLICLVDSAIGAGIGFFYQSTLIGGITGAIFGLLNYWIVSIKLLKLKPKF